jgi:hypothetical protein
VTKEAFDALEMRLQYVENLLNCARQQAFQDRLILLAGMRESELRILSAIEHGRRAPDRPGTNDKSSDIRRSPHSH